MKYIKKVATITVLALCAVALLVFLELRHLMQMTHLYNPKNVEL